VESYKVALTGDIVSPPRIPQAPADSGQSATGRCGNASMLLTKVLFHGPRKRIKKKKSRGTPFGENRTIGTRLL
jgi:hypothetical protein